MRMYGRESFTLLDEGTTRTSNPWNVLFLIVTGASPAALDGGTDDTKYDSRSICHKILRGGVGLVSDLSSSSQRRCSSGFFAKTKHGRDGIISSGHCLRDRAGFDWGVGRGYEQFVEIGRDLSHDPRQLPETHRLCQVSTMTRGWSVRYCSAIARTETCLRSTSPSRRCLRGPNFLPGRGFTSMWLWTATDWRRAHLLG